MSLGGKLAVVAIVLDFAIMIYVLLRAKKIAEKFSALKVLPNAE